MFGGETRLVSRGYPPGRKFRASTCELELAKLAICACKSKMPKLQVLGGGEDPRPQKGDQPALKFSDSCCGLCFSTVFLEPVTC